MAAITLRVGAAANLTAAQVDANFTNVNNELVADTAAIALNADAAATTAAIAAVGAQNAVTISGNTTLTKALHDSRTLEVTASCTLTLNLDATDGWVPPGTTASGSSLYIQCAAGVVITWAGTATITPTVGASNAADSTVARLIGLDHSLTANTWIVTSVQVGAVQVCHTDLHARHDPGVRRQ